VGGFIPSLYDTLEEQLCIDTTREFAAGESNGGMMTYQLGVDLSSRLAAIAPQFGSFHRGFNLAPSVGVPVIDLHGTRDTTVPANVSLSGDGYYYTTTHEIFNGNAYSTGWKSANNCSGESSHYVTKYDNVRDLWCVLEGNCSGGDVVRCSYSGGHNWFNNGGKKNGGVVTDFLLQWTKPSHVGRGYSKGEAWSNNATLLEDITVHDPSDGQYDPSKAPQPKWPEGTLETATAGHYGNPAKGCLKDEVILPIASGHVCAPAIGIGENLSFPPVPKCKLGGVAASSNGCPMDADNIGRTSQAWPICLAKGNITDGYDAGDFVCLLVCPCEAGVGNLTDSDCGSEANSHCPLGARCERDELRKRDQGICTYPFTSTGGSLTLLV